MKRSPIVLAGTAAGLAGVLAYHTSGPRNLVFAGAGATLTARGGGGASTTTRGSTTRGSTTAAGGPTTTATGSASPSGPGQPGPAERAAVGQAVSYPYGDLQVKVTARGSRIVAVSISRLAVPDAQSGSIDQYAVPVLQRQALAAQSANIDGVSGASFTTAAYRQSLQSALDKLT